MDSLKTGHSIGGDNRDRTGDLLLAKQALSQLSYIPNVDPGPRPASTKLKADAAARGAPRSDSVRGMPARLFGNSRAVVGLGRVELPTSRLSGVRSNHLSYRPDLPCSRSCLKKEKRRRRNPALVSRIRSDS